MRIDGGVMSQGYLLCGITSCPLWFEPQSWGNNVPR